MVVHSNMESQERRDMGVNLQRSYHLNNALKKNFKERTMEKKILSSSSEMKWTEKKSGG